MLQAVPLPPSAPPAPSEHTTPPLVRTPSTRAQAGVRLRSRAGWSCRGGPRYISCVLEKRKSVRLVDSNPPSSRWSLWGRRVSEVQFSRPRWPGQRAPVVACYLAPLLGPARAQPSWSGPRNCHAPTARANPRAGASGRLLGSSGTADWAFALIVTGYKGSRPARLRWLALTDWGRREA